MAFTKMGNFTFNHAEQPDKLNLPAAETKAKFDSRANELKTAFNAAVDLLNATAAGDSGADNVGAAAIDGIEGASVQAQMVGMKGYVDAHKAETANSTTVHGLRYEEGNWTPTIYGVSTAGSHTYTTQSGRYIKINKKVTCYGYITLSAKDAAMAGDVKIGGLPFTASSSMGSINFGYIDSLDFGTGELYLAGYPNSTRIDLTWVKDNAAPTKLQPAQVQNNTSLIFTFEYYVS